MTKHRNPRRRSAAVRRTHRLDGLVAPAVAHFDTLADTTATMYDGYVPRERESISLTENANTGKRGAAPAGTYYRSVEAQTRTARAFGRGDVAIASDTGEIRTSLRVSTPIKRARIEPKTTSYEI